MLDERPGVFHRMSDLPRLRELRVISHYLTRPLRSGDVPCIHMNQDRHADVGGLHGDTASSGGRVRPAINRQGVHASLRSDTPQGGREPTASMGSLRASCMAS